MVTKLEDFLEEMYEKTTKNNQYPVLTSSKNGLFLQDDYFKKQVASKDNTGYKIIRRGEFTYRAMSDTGEFYPNILECAEIGIVSPAYPVFRISNDIILPDYLKYYFRSSSFQRSITSFVQGSTRASMKFAKMKTIDIDLPSKADQRKKVQKLDLVRSQIETKTKELVQLDSLIKARFVEMFGDAYKASKYPKQKWTDVVTVKNGRDYKKVAVNDGGYPVYGTGGEMARASDFLCPENTIIVGRKGTINNPLLVREKFWNVDTAFGVIPGNKLHYLYFFWFCKMFDFSRLNKQAVLPSTTKADLLNIEMQVPPIEVQNQFAVFVAQVDKSKFALGNELAMGSFYIRLIYDRIMHGRIDL